MDGQPGGIPIRGVTGSIGPELVFRVLLAELYCSGMNDRYEIWLMEADGSKPRRVTHLVYEGAAPGEPPEN